jgi:hypothetical protein
MLVLMIDMVVLQWAVQLGAAIRVRLLLARRFSSLVFFNGPLCKTLRIFLKKMFVGNFSSEATRTGIWRDDRNTSVNGNFLTILRPMRRRGRQHLSALPCPAQASHPLQITAFYNCVAFAK